MKEKPQFHVHIHIQEVIERFKRRFQLYSELYKQRRYKEIAYRLKRYRYVAFILLAIIAVFVPWL